ncbi:MAG: ATP-dependent DNA helicase Rep [ANME-2 cluster archaeon]|nr:ATP-dependent DNA helicase Rep [ANME-2 cluster archaeon]
MTSGLVDRQQDAVTHTSGPLLILAGAGTGKTTTIAAKNRVYGAGTRDHIRSNLMVEQKFTVPLGAHLFKGFIDRVDLIPGTDNEVAIIDYKTGGEPGLGERSRQLLFVCTRVQTPVS